MPLAIRSFTVAALAAGLLAGCAADQRVVAWTKPNVSEEQRDKDYSTCRRLADQQMAGMRGVHQDLDVMSGGTTSGIKPSLGQNLSAYNDSKRFDSLVNTCMTEAGYTAVK